MADRTSLTRIEACVTEQEPQFDSPQNGTAWHPEYERLFPQNGH